MKLTEQEQITQEEEALEQIFSETIEDINGAFADYGISNVREALLFYRNKIEAAITEFEFRYGPLH